MMSSPETDTEALQRHGFTEVEMILETSLLQNFKN